MTDNTTQPDLEGALRALDDTDRALRGLWRELAEDPDRHGELEARVAELRERRLTLAQRVGIALLREWRAREADGHPPVSQVYRTPIPPPPSAQARADDGENAGHGGHEEPTADTQHLDEGGSHAEQDGPHAGDDDGAGTPNTERASAEMKVGQRVDGGGAADRVGTEALEEWKDAVRATGLGASAPRPSSSGRAPWPLVLSDLMDRLGAPRDTTSAVDAIEEADALDAVSSPEQQERWAELPRHVQQLWLSLMVARARRLRELPSASDLVRNHVRDVILRFPAWAKAHAPGHVNGLQVKHVPAGPSWSDDARELWRALSVILEPELHLRAPDSKRARPKRVSDAEAPESESSDVPWASLPAVRGARAVMLGGDPREPNRVRLERALELASLEWPPIDGPRRVDAATARIRGGAYDLVIVLGAYVFHHQSEPIIEAARETGVPWALAEGYGVSAVRRAIERFLSDHPTDAPLARGAH